MTAGARRLHDHVQGVVVWAGLGSVQGNFDPRVVRAWRRAGRRVALHGRAPWEQPCACGSSRAHVVQRATKASCTAVGARSVEAVFGTIPDGGRPWLREAAAVLLTDQSVSETAPGSCRSLGRPSATPATAPATSPPSSWGPPALGRRRPALLRTRASRSSRQRRATKPSRSPYRLSATRRPSSTTSSTRAGGTPPDPGFHSGLSGRPRRQRQYSLTEMRMRIVSSHAYYPGHAKTLRIRLCPAP